jgi:hypothetical protein
MREKEKEEIYREDEIFKLMDTYMEFVPMKARGESTSVS